MKREVLILGIEHEFILKEFILFTTKEIGTLKMNEIIKKVNSSGKVAKFLTEARRINLRLGTEDFLVCIHSSSSFIFSKAETISIAGIVLLMKWNHEVGKPQGMSEDIYLNKRFFSILDKCNGSKTHVSSVPNFFERFNDHLERLVTLNVIKNNTQVVKTEISFDSVLCGAIKSGEKTEFRVIDNLEGINFEPNDWKFEGYDNEKRAIFISNFLGETFFVECPYKPGSTIIVFDSSNSSKVDSQIKITSCYIQRIKKVNQDDAIKEGFRAYKERAEELFKKDPSLDVELCLFDEDWKEKFGSGIFARNIWLWVVEFKQLDVEIKSAISTAATTLGLTKEQLANLANASL